mmetsp:Transcript_3238/g.6551  ORF Transcript_3238/g.6551 Transcript_3238/m.6551 type:complete len:323 (+) Transcript_3238:28-996(+)
MEMVALLRCSTITLMSSLLTARRFPSLLAFNSFDVTPLRPSSSSAHRCNSVGRALSDWSHLMMSASGGAFEVAQFPCLGDNYGYLIHDPKTGQTAAFDTPCATAYKKELERRGWTLSHIFNTHKHHDHVGGNKELKGDGVKIFGPASDGNIPGMDVPLKGGDKVSFAGSEAEIIDVGGHTLGHIAYYFPSEKTAFVGDSLFALGCGRMFEGTPTQFWSSLLRLRELPDDTTVYCAHEYTESNAKFAISIEPGNLDLVRRVKEIKAQRSRGEPTVPSLMGEEKLTNPFLRGDVSAEIRKNVGANESDSGAEIFAKIRRRKDNF